MAKKLALVVHGIGEQQAGETLDALVGGLTGDSACTIETELRHLRERDRDKPDGEDCRDQKLYPCHIRRVKQGGDETIFAEAFWGDISRGSTGQVRGLIELFKLIMGLGHVVRENAAEIYENPKATPRRAANMFVYLIHGPITAFNFAIALAVALLFLVQWQFGQVAWDGTAAMLASAAVLLVGWKLLSHPKESYLYQIFHSWLLFGAIGLVVMVALSHAMTFLLSDARNTAIATVFGSRCEEGQLFSDCMDFWYAALLIAILTACWGICIVIVAATGFWETVRRIKLGQGAHKALYPQALTLVLTIWMIIVVMLWVAVSQIVVQSAAQFGLDTVNIDVMEKGMLPAINFVFYVSIALGIIALGSVIAWADRKIWTGRYGQVKQDKVPIRRLIVHPMILIGLTLAIVVIAIGAWKTTEAHLDLIAIEGRLTQIDLPDEVKDGIFNYTLQGYHFQQKFVAIFAVISSLIVMSYTYFRHYLAMGIGVAKDIVVFFVRRPSPSVSEPADKNVHPFRNRIQDRLVHTLILMIQSENPDEVVIVSHSQGTVISIEALRGGRMRAQFKSAGLPAHDIALVTMGSPASHLYGFYFSKAFDLTSKHASQDVEDGIASWLNIYRLDDFVGTEVEGPDPKLLTNEWVPAKGHTGYWTDDCVLRHLKNYTFPEFLEGDI